MAASRGGAEGGGRGRLVTWSWFWLLASGESDWRPFVMNFADVGDT